MIEGLRALSDLLAGYDFDAFAIDGHRQAAAVRYLEVIGEAASHMPENVKAMAPDIPWASIRGIRNVLAHRYYEIDLPLIWSTAQVLAPETQVNLRRLLAALPDDA